MANFDTIKTAIDANIKTNGTQDITGGKMNSILKQMVDATEEQLTGLESEIKEQVITDDLLTYCQLGYIDAYGSGVIAEPKEGNLCVVLPVKGGDKFEYTCDNAIDLNAYFDKDKKRISRFITGKGTQILVVPDNARYMGLTIQYNGLGSRDGQRLYGLNGYLFNSLKNKLFNPEQLYVTEVQYESGKYLQLSDGQAVAYADTCYVTDFLPLSQNLVYLYSGARRFESACWCFYNSRKKFISAKSSNGIALETFKNAIIEEIPSDAEYIRFSSLLSELKVDVLTLYSNHLKVALPLYGKKWVCVGDSLTEHNVRALKNYHDYVSEETGISVINLGVSGTGYKNAYNGSQPFYQRITEVPTDADVVTIFGSGNDLGYELGNIDDNTEETICGCINLTIQRLIEHFPTCKLGIVTPTPWWTYTPNIANNKMMMMCDAIIAIAQKYSIPVLDLYRESNLHPNIEICRNLTYSRDDGGGVHPDENGHRIIASRFKTFIESIL